MTAVDTQCSIIDRSTIKSTPLASRAAAMDPHGGTSWWFPTDILVESLQRLPPNARRRFRLVCRRWRKLVDKRSFPHRSKTLVVTDQGSAFIVNVQTERLKELWSGRTPARCRGMRVVGTCNLVCLTTGKKLSAVHGSLPCASSALCRAVRARQ
jgi:hypothetical protein